MLTNETRRELLHRVRASGYPGSITEVFQAADQGIDLIEQHQLQQQQQEMQVANTPQEQEVGLREQHAMGNTQASMAFPDVQPNQSFNTVGMQAPIDINKYNDQGHLVESYENVPPGIQDLPTGPYEGTIIESPAAYQKGGFPNQFNTNYQESKNYQKIVPREGHRPGPGGTKETHLMAHDPNTLEAWPTLFQDENGNWFEPVDAYSEAKRRGEIYKFDSLKEVEDFAVKGNWKPSKKQKGGRRKYQNGGANEDVSYASQMESYQDSLASYQNQLEIERIQKLQQQADKSLQELPDTEYDIIAVPIEGQKRTIRNKDGSIAEFIDQSSSEYKTWKATHERLGDTTRFLNSKGEVDGGYDFEGFDVTIDKEIQAENKKISDSAYKYSSETYFDHVDTILDLHDENVERGIHAGKPGGGITKEGYQYTDFEKKASELKPVKPKKPKKILEMPTLDVKPLPTAGVPSTPTKAIPFELVKHKASKERFYTIQGAGTGTNTMPLGDDGKELIILKDHAGRVIFRGSQTEFQERYGEHLERGTHGESSSKRRKSRLYLKKQTGGLKKSKYISKYGVEEFQTGGLQMLAPEDYVSTPNENIGNRFATMPIVEPKKEVVPWEVKKGIRVVESSDGKLMKNPNSSATGLYGQLYNEIKNLDIMKGVTRDEFAADTTLQNQIFAMRWKDEIPGIPGLKKTAEYLQKTYGSVTDDYTLNELAVLVNYLGRERARKYFASLRDKKSFKMPGNNKSPEDYIKEYRKSIKRSGGYRSKYQTGGEKMPVYGSILKKYQNGGEKEYYTKPVHSYEVTDEEIDGYIDYDKDLYEKVHHMRFEMGNLFPVISVEELTAINYEQYTNPELHRKGYIEMMNDPERGRDGKSRAQIELEKSIENTPQTEEEREAAYLANAKKYADWQQESLDERDINSAVYTGDGKYSDRTNKQKIVDYFNESYEEIVKQKREGIKNILIKIKQIEEEDPYILQKTPSKKAREGQLANLRRQLNNLIAELRVHQDRSYSKYLEGGDTNLELAQEVSHYGGSTDAFIKSAQEYGPGVFKKLMSLGTEDMMEFQKELTAIVEPFKSKDYSSPKTIKEQIKKGWEWINDEDLYNLDLSSLKKYTDKVGITKNEVYNIIKGRIIDADLGWAMEKAALAVAYTKTRKLKKGGYRNSILRKYQRGGVKEYEDGGLKKKRYLKKGGYKSKYCW